MTKTFKIISSPLNREKSIVKKYIPKNEDEFRAFIGSATNKQLLEVGFLIHDYSNGLRKYGLFLFPCEWYNVIPNGFQLTGLYFHSQVFIKNVSDNDTRYGCLPYGVIREII